MLLVVVVVVVPDQVIDHGSVHVTQEPVLSAEDVERLSFKVNHRKPFSILKKVPCEN